MGTFQLAMICLLLFSKCLALLTYLSVPMFNMGKPLIWKAKRDQMYHLLLRWYHSTNICWSQMYAIWSYVSRIHLVLINVSMSHLMGFLMVWFTFAVNTLMPCFRIPLHIAEALLVNLLFVHWTLEHLGTLKVGQECQAYRKQ